MALSIALQTYYKFLETHHTIFPCFNTFYEFLRDVFVRVLKEDKVKEKAKEKFGDFLRKNLGEPKPAPAEPPKEEAPAPSGT